MATTIQTQHIGNEQAIDLGYAVLVQSKTSPGAWYQVLPVRPQHCTCDGFAYRGMCRHISVAELAQLPTRPVASPTTPLAKRLSKCQVPTGKAVLALTSLDND